MTDYILAIDQGTTSSRAILFDTRGRIQQVAQREFTQFFPADGWVEHDPEEIWSSVLDCCREVIGHTSAGDSIRGIGITNQRETTVVWDKHTGQAVCRAIVWQDRRTSSYCQSIRSDALQQSIQQKTGLLLDPYFSATKLHWILEHIDGARDKAERGELLFGTVDTWLIWKLTSGASHVTDATNACRTMLFNIHTQQWDETLLAQFNIPASMLPAVLDSAADFGVTTPELLGQAIPIAGVAGDQQAALIGQTCFEEGMAKSTYGTGCFLILNTGVTALTSHHRLLTTVAYRLNGEVCYALEGSIFIAGAAIQWLRDGLKLIEHAGDSEPLARQTPLDHGVYLVPAFTGLGAPYWDPEARGAIFGLTRDTGIKEIVTAGLQSVCYQTRDLQTAMSNDGQTISTLRVDGGMVANDWVMQFLADILGSTVDRPEIIETTALGAAYLAGLQVGIFPSLQALADLWQCDRRFEPALSEDQREKLYRGWQHAVARVQSGDWTH